MQLNRKPKTITERNSKTRNTLRNEVSIPLLCYMLRLTFFVLVSTDIKPQQ